MSEREEEYEEVEVTTLEERLRLAVTVAFHEGYREGLSERRLFGAYKFDAERAQERVVGLLHAIRVLSVENRVVIRRAPSPTTDGVEDSHSAEGGGRDDAVLASDAPGASASGPAGAPEEPVFEPYKWPTVEMAWENDPDGGYYVARLKDFPGVMACEPTRDEAFASLLSAVVDCMKAFELWAAPTEPSPAALREWLPIETAPKDGTPVLAISRNGARRWKKPVVVWWTHRGWAWSVDANLCPQLTYTPPEMWQALPEPPTRRIADAMEGR